MTVCIHLLAHTRRKKSPQFYAQKKKAIKLKIMDVQTQAGGCDCKEWYHVHCVCVPHSALGLVVASNLFIVRIIISVILVQ